MAVAGEQVVDERRDEGTEDHADCQAADDCDGEGLQHLGACAECECERKHAGDGGESGHEDGPEPALSGELHAVERGVALCAEAFVCIKQQDAVFGDDADDHDEAHEAGDVEGDAGEEQGRNDATDGEDRGREDGDGSGEVAELRKQDGEDEDKG